MKTRRTVMVLAMILLVAGSAAPALPDTAPTGESTAPHTFHLPASYVGTIPCADCAGIRMILTMGPDSVYLLRRVYKEAKGGKDESVTVHGRWRVSADEQVLYLFRGDEIEASFTILSAEALRLRDRDNREIASSLNYDLKRAEGLDTIPEVLHLTGYYSVYADSGFFFDCGAAHRIAVATEGARAALDSAYTASRKIPGEAVLATLDGRLEWRQKFEAMGVRLVLAVEKLDRFWPGMRCGDELGATGLDAGVWELVELDGEPVTAQGQMQLPTMEFDTPEGRVAGVGTCNRYTASYEAKGDSLHVGPAAATKMACVQGAAIEDSFFAMLGRITLYQIDGPVLLLFAGEELLAKLRLRG